MAASASSASSASVPPLLVQAHSKMRVLGHQKTNSSNSQEEECTLLEGETRHDMLTDDIDGIVKHGWVILMKKCPISDSNELEKLASELGPGFALPEMTFGANQLHLHHAASGVTLSFTTRGALEVCRAGESAEGFESLKVGCAEHWEKASSEQDIKSLDKTYDWTYASNYTGSLGCFQERDGEAQPGELSSLASAVEVEQCEDQIDYDQLRRPDPIRWFRELCLFEDELHDNGVSSYTVKVRVMPHCFFVLARLWLRVDGVLLRVRDTRVYHVFGSSQVLREVSTRHASVQEMVKAGHSSDMSSYMDPNLVARQLPLLPGHPHTYTERILLGAATATTATGGGDNSSSSSNGQPPSGETSEVPPPPPPTSR